MPKVMPITSPLAGEEKQIHNDEQFHLRQMEREVAQKKKEREKQMEEELDYITFPSIMGWYFDGVFTEPYGLNEDYAVHFNELQAELDVIADYEQAETFTELQRRNFWPPKFFGCCFRTRGIYLDFREVKKDPPRTPPEINYEAHHELIGVCGDDFYAKGDGDHDDDDVSLEGSSTAGRNRITAMGAGKKIAFARDKGGAMDDFYWEHFSGTFERKNPELKGQYYYDEGQKIWKTFVGGVVRRPWDYFYNEAEGSFEPKDRQRPQDYTWVDGINCWKKKGLVGPPASGMIHTDFYWDEGGAKWIPLRDRVGAIQDYLPGRKKIKRGVRGLSGRNQEDYFYDSTSGSMVLKDFSRDTAAAFEDYFFDPWESKWRFKNRPGQHVLGNYPSDYVFNDITGGWSLRPEKERERVTPYHYYFDDSLGRFYPRDKIKKLQYHWDSSANVYKLNNAPGPSSNGLTSDDYCWLEDQCVWALIDKNMDAVEDHGSIRRKVVPGKRGRNNLVADDFYYDGETGKFLAKTKKRFEDYFFDPWEEVWRKVGEPYGPGRSGLYPEEYYFDTSSGTWKERSDNVKLHQPLDSVFKTPYDYYFDFESGKFFAKKEDSTHRHTYVWDPEYKCYINKKTRAEAGKHKARLPSDYFYDEFRMMWDCIEESPYKGEVEEYGNAGGRKNRFGLRAKNGLTSDDWYYDLADEKFREKQEGMNYEYNAASGVWILPGQSEKLGRVTRTKHPDNFYYSDCRGVFKRKEDDYQDHVFLDKNAHLWRERRRKPNEYKWDENLGLYTLGEKKIMDGKVHSDGSKKKKKKKKGKLGKGEAAGIPPELLYRPNWADPAMEDIYKQQGNVGRWIDLKKKGPSWGHPDWHTAEHRLHHDKPGKVVFN